MNICIIGMLVLTIAAFTWLQMGKGELRVCETPQRFDSTFQIHNQNSWKIELSYQKTTCLLLNKIFFPSTRIVSWWLVHLEEFSTSPLKADHSLLLPVPTTPITPSPPGMHGEPRRVWATTSLLMHKVRCAGGRMLKHLASLCFIKLCCIEITYECGWRS